MIAQHSVLGLIKTLFFVLKGQIKLILFTINSPYFPVPVLSILYYHRPRLYDNQTV